MAIILENKVIDVIKNVNNKKCAPELIFLMKKKIEKDLDHFLTWKIDFESQILALFDTSP